MTYSWPPRSILRRANASGPNVTSQVAAAARSNSWFGSPRWCPLCRPSWATIRGSGLAGYGGGAGWRRHRGACGQTIVRCGCVGLGCCIDLRWVNCAMVQAVRESPVGSARRSPTVEHHPVGDSVTAVARVVRAVEATPDFCGELSLLIGITGRKVSPCGRGDQTCQADGFGIDRREQPGGAERRRLGARRVRTSARQVQAR